MLLGGSCCSQENLGNRGRRGGHTVGPTVAQGGIWGPKGIWNPGPSVFAKGAMCGVCGSWVEGRGPGDLSQHLPPAHCPILVADSGRAWSWLNFH